LCRAGSNASFEPAKSLNVPRFADTGFRRSCVKGNVLFQTQEYSTGSIRLLLRLLIEHRRNRPLQKRAKGDLLEQTRRHSHPVQPAFSSIVRGHTAFQPWSLWGCFPIGRQNGAAKSQESLRAPSKSADFPTKGHLSCPWNRNRSRCRTRHRFEHAFRLVPSILALLPKPPKRHLLSRRGCCQRL